MSSKPRSNVSGQVLAPFEDPSAHHQRLEILQKISCPLSEFFRYWDHSMSHWAFSCHLELCRQIEPWLVFLAEMGVFAVAWESLESLARRAWQVKSCPDLLMSAIVVRS